MLQRPWKDIKDNKLKHKNLENENKHLNSELHKQLMNANVQYMHSTWMLKIFIIPTSKDEDTKVIVYKLASLAQDFSKGQIDVAHRISSKPSSQIIVFFHKKKDRKNFFKQRYKVKTHSDQTNSVMTQRKNITQKVVTQNLHKTYIHKNVTKEIEVYLSLLRRKQRNLLHTNKKVAQWRGKSA